MISVKPFVEAEREAVCALSVADEQRDFVASNRDSLAEADLHDYCTPLVIHADGELIGFAMYALDPDDGNYWLYRLMIDRKHQRRGHGLAAMTELLRLISALPDCQRIVLGVEPNNVGAAALYRRAGFRDSGAVIGGEMVMIHEITPL